SGRLVAGNPGRLPAGNPPAHRSAAGQPGPADLRPGITGQARPAGTVHPARRTVALAQTTTGTAGFGAPLAYRRHRPDHRRPPRLAAGAPEELAQRQCGRTGSAAGPGLHAPDSEPFLPFLGGSADPAA